jgi:Ca-activated chloride channel homolog
MNDFLKNIDWNKFHFLREEYVWVAIPGLILLLFGFIFFKESNPWKKKIAKHLQPYVIQKGTEWKTRLVQFSVLFMFIIGFIGFLGPTWNEIESPAKKIRSRLVIAMDLSQSMLAKDISPNRLERAKFKIHDFLDANPGAETSLLVFAASTHTAIPFTTDYKIIKDQLDGLKPSMMPVKGTGFHALFHKLDILFNDNKAEGKVLLVTDDLTDLPIESVSNFLQNNNVHLYIYTFATPSGAVIPNFRQKSSLDMQKYKALEALDKLDLMEVTLDDSDVKDFAMAIRDNLIFEDKSDENEENWQDNGYWLLIPLTLLFLFSFRKGWAMYLLLITISLSSCSEKEKQKKGYFSFDDLWYTKEYQAQKEYDEGNYLKAANEFEDPLRKGVAYYKAGDFISAQNAFEKDTTTQGLYNLGLTYARLGQLDKSQEIFEKILQKDPNNINANSNLQHIITARSELDSLKPEEIALNEKGKRAENKQNDSPEDLSGGGQKATEKDMEKERREETTETGKRKGKELDELPDDFESGKGALPKNILMRKVDDDPALFLTRKFRYQIKKKQVETEKTAHQW